MCFSTFLPVQDDASQKPDVSDERPVKQPRVPLKRDSRRRRARACDARGCASGFPYFKKFAMLSGVGFRASTL